MLSRQKVVTVINRLLSFFIWEIPRRIKIIIYDVPRIFGQWIRFNGTEVKAVEESTGLEENFSETEGSAQITTVLLYMVDN
jgi:hypothetical protein